LDELLLREGNKVASGNLMSTLQRSSGGEGPAGTALSLVLNRGDGTLGSPVDLVSEVGGVELGNGVSLLLVSLVGVHGGSLLRSVVRELVDTDGPGVAVLGVVLVDELEVLGEVVESVVILTSGCR
jgi:hypothetical protein